MFKKLKTSLLGWFGFLPPCSFHTSHFRFSYEGIFGSLFYLCLMLFAFFIAIFGRLPDEKKVTNLFVVENEHHQIKFKTDGNCVLRETCCHHEKHSYAYGEYELMGDTIIIQSKQLNRKNFNRLSIMGKKVKLISSDKKRNDYFTFDIVEDNRNEEP
ncbi:hypothetical protein ACE193_18000 [Bernardetia sp. OM2101]|uniref:hypothetical protein n=1 Tax=Bernardetia sp. OM2101 TaxID=3344876 RepID=UPI0035D0DDE1